MVLAPEFAAGFALCSAFALGVATATGTIDLGDRRWIHHAMYAAAAATTAGAAAIAIVRRRPSVPSLLAVLALLALLPRTSGGSGRHTLVASTAMAVYFLGLTRA